MGHKDLWIAPAGEATLILAVAITGWATHQPLIFTSLGPTAYEMIETPQRKSARPYNVLAGHAIAIIAGYAALIVTRAWYVPKVGLAAGVPLPRVWAAVVAALLTVLFTLLLKATQPAALSTTLLIALGNMQAPRDAGLIFGAVLLMTIVGEPLRRLRARAKQQDAEESS